MTTQETRHFDSDQYQILRDQIAELIDGSFTVPLHDTHKQAWKKLFSLLPAYDATEKRFITLRMEAKIREFRNTKVSATT